MVSSVGILDRILHPNGRELMVTWDAFLRSKVPNPETRKRYEAVVKSFNGWRGSRSLTDATVQEYREKLLGDYKPNSLSNMVAAINLYLESKGVEARVKRPPKEIAANPKLVKPDEYAALLARIPSAEERLAVRLLHDTGLRPSDIVSVRLSDLDTTDGITSVRKRTRKTGAVTDSLLSKETATELKAYVEAAGVTDFIFRGETDRPHRHRTWPNHVLAKYGADGITPRTFRRTLATNWTEDTTSLMAQGGWTDSKTIFLHYRRDVRARHVQAFEKAVGPVREPEPDDEPQGYR
jgi:integrase